jgi:hypothetical protein
MKAAPLVAVFACDDRQLRGFSLQADGSNLPARPDGSQWVSVAAIPMTIGELEKYAVDPACVLVNLRERGYDVAAATAKILQFPAPHRSSA